MEKNLTGKTYYIDPVQLGDMNDGIKVKRPIFLLCGINNEWFFGVLSTRTKHIGRKNTFQHKEYLEWEKGSFLRKDSLLGWTTIKKIDIKNDRRNLKEKIILNKKQKEEILKFYNEIIKNEKNRLKT